MVSAAKRLKLHHFDRSLPVIRTQVCVPQRRRVRLVAGELLDLEQRNSRGDQARAVRVTEIVIAKRRPQIRFLGGLLESQPAIERSLVALWRDENLFPRRTLS
jgi:hypothetical protein